MFTIDDTDGKEFAVANGDMTDYVGKVLILKPQFLRKTYRKPEYQLVRAENFNEESDDEFVGICCYGDDELTFRKDWFIGVANAEVEQYADELEMAPIAYKQIYLPDYYADGDRPDCTPVCFNEFIDCEWSDPEIREYYLHEVRERMLIDKTKKNEAEM